MQHYTKPAISASFYYLYLLLGNDLYLQEERKKPQSYYLNMQRTSSDIITRQGDKSGHGAARENELTRQQIFSITDHSVLSVKRAVVVVIVSSSYKMPSII